MNKTFEAGKGAEELLENKEPNMSKRHDGKTFSEVLAYADEPAPYVPRAGDVIKIKATVCLAKDEAAGGETTVVVHGNPMRWGLNKETLQACELVSRGDVRRVTKAEIEELLGEEIEIISE